MGTSTSSAGAGAGVSFDPPWLDDVDSSIDSGTADTPMISSTGTPAEPGSGDEGTTEAEPVERPDTGQTIAPPGRYQEARRALTGFVKSGDRADLQRSISSFVRKGMGGPTRAVSRMRTTATAAASLGGLLAAVRERSDADVNSWVSSVKQRALSARDTALEVIRRILPVGGSIDEESAKDSMSKAINHLYEADPDADIFNLTDDQIARVMTYTIAHDVYNRVQLELGRVFEKLKYSPSVIQERLSQALDYVLVVVQRSMEKVRSGKAQHSMRGIAVAALHDALLVFAES